MINIQSNCACGAVRVELPSECMESRPPEAVDCHCSACRKFHVAAFASYLAVPSNESGDGSHHEFGPLIVHGKEHLKTFDKDACAEVGNVDRMYCGECCSKLFSRTSEGSMLLNLGPVQDDSVPSSMLDSWRKDRKEWQTSAKAIWTDCEPIQRRQRTGQASLPQRLGPFVVEGSCACKACRYRIDWSRRPTEVQHCYCRLCRRLSGGPFQSWIPVYKHDFQWILMDGEADDNTIKLSGAQTPPADSPLWLQRTTSHGQRHCCRQCGSVLTIVYDLQDDHVWPAAGGLDDICDPHDIAKWETQVKRVIHICCRYKQEWYNLPNDGLPRILGAS